jgi:hypothetical protein
MRFSRIIRFNRFLLVVNLLVLVLIGTFFALDCSKKGQGDILEARRIILRGENGIPSIILQGDDENTLMTLNDKNGQARLQLQGGAFPAMIIKNEAQEIVGTFFPLKDGGTAIGLGDADGNMATFLRGGDSPTLSLFHQSNEPNIALGIANQIPHFVMFPFSGKDGMLIHGSSPTTLLFIDEEGKISVSLSRYGLYHESAPSQEEGEKKEGKLFSSWDELKKTLNSFE